MVFEVNTGGAMECLPWLKRITFYIVNEADVTTVSIGISTNANE